MKRRIVKPNYRVKGRIVEKYGTARKFSDAVDCHETFVSQVINRRRSLGREQKELWAKTLGCAVSEIFPD